MARLLRPRSLAGQRGEWVAMAACLLVLATLFTFDLVTPSAVTVSGLFTLPVGTAAWLFRGRLAAAVVTVAVVLLVVLAFDFRLPAVTAASRLLAVLLIGTFGYLAATTTVALEKVRERRLRVLLEAAARLREGAGEDSALEVAAEAAARFVSHGEEGLRRAAVWRLTSEGSAELAAESASRRQLDTARVTLDAPLRRLLEGARPHSFAVMELPPEMQDALQGVGVREVAMAAVRVGGRPWGLLSAGGLDGKPFDAEELELLQGLADLLAVALRRAG